MPASAILLIIASVLQSYPSASEPGLFPQGGRVTLGIEWASGSTCDLTVDVHLSTVIPRSGFAALACDGRKTLRPLDVKEADEFLRLARLANLYHVVGIGGDTRAADMWFATLKVADRGSIKVLVVSANQEFGSGPRQSLLQFLEDRLVELRPRLKPIPRR